MMEMTAGVVWQEIRVHFNMDRMDDRIVFSVPWFEILERSTNSESAPHYLLRANDYVSVLASTSDGSLLMVRQYRPAVKSHTLELPSGHIERGESSEIAAARELAEETGYEATGFEHLGTLAPDTGRMLNKLWCYYAFGATESRSASEREHGVELVRIAPGELLRRVNKGEINHALTLAVLMLAAVKGRLSVASHG
jgi:8-oxo-dGTP pyrophosphatase MutT (NUDIX family)